MTPGDDALVRLAVTLVSWRDAGANAPVEPVVRDIVNLLASARGVSGKVPVAQEKHDI